VNLAMYQMNRSAITAVLKPARARRSASLAESHSEMPWVGLFATLPNTALEPSARMRT